MREFNPRFTITNRMTSAITQIERARKKSGTSMKIFLSKSARKKQETDNFMGVPIYGEQKAARLISRVGPLPTASFGTSFGKCT